MTDYQIQIDMPPQDADIQAINAGLNDYNHQAVGPYGGRRVGVIVRNAQQEIVGGLLSHIGWGWLHVDTFWLSEQARGGGLGRQMLAKAEDQARRLGCTAVHLDTFSFQAPGFYQKMGYEIFGQLSGYPGQHTRYFLHKKLVSP